jgi:selenocysteine-specific elongation factor
VGTIGIVDVPGHEAFIRTMLAGASGIDIALLVIAADEGVMPQTEEHLEILDILGVKRRIVALTKCDLVDDEWLDLLKEEVAPLVNRAGDASWPIVPVSARTGEGIDYLRDMIGRLARSVPSRSGNGDIFRMPIDRAFSVKGTGTVVTGTVWSGTMTRDANLVVKPSGKSFRVRSIEHHGASAEAASAGERTAIALTGIELDDVGRGNVLVSEPEWTGTREINAIVEVNRGDVKITSRTRLLFHHGTSEVEARFSAGHAGLEAGQAEMATIYLKEPVVVRAGDRFVLRLPSPARTIGGGIILDPYPQRKSKRTAVRDLNGKRPKSVDSPVGSLLYGAGLDGLTTKSLSIRTWLTPGQVKTELSKIDAISVGAREYSPVAGEFLMDRIATMSRRA